MHRRYIQFFFIEFQYIMSFSDIRIFLPLNEDINQCLNSHKNLFKIM